MDDEPRHISESLPSAPQADPDEARAHEVAQRTADHEVEALQAERKKLAEEMQLHPDDPNLPREMTVVTQSLLSAQADRHELSAAPAPADTKSKEQSTMQPWVDTARHEVATFEEMRDAALKRGDQNEAEAAQAAADGARARLDYREIVQDNQTS